MRSIIRASIFWATLLLATVAFAADSLLSHDSSKVADTYEKLATDGHYIQFNAPAWPHTFPEELQIYGYRFGKVAGTLGTVVLWDLQPVPSPAQGAPTRQAHIILTQQFKLTDAPEKAGWFSIPLQAAELPKTFGVSVYTRSTDTAGLWVGLTAASKQGSHSSAGIIKLMAQQPRMKMRRDGRDWLIHLRVRDAIQPQDAITTDQISGSGFAYNDDGSAEGFATTQKDGPIVKFTNDGGHRLRRVFVYARLTGTNWFNSDRQAGVWVMNQDYGILCHANLAYNVFTNDPAWGFVELPDIQLPQTFYVLVEPVSRPQAALEVGYDSSGKNRGSLFGSAGALHKWAIEAPEDKANWMIRVEYR